MKRKKKKTLTLSHAHTPHKGSVSLIITHLNYSNTFPQHLVIIFQLTRTSCTAALHPAPQRVSASDDLNYIFSSWTRGVGGWRECSGRPSKHVVIREDKINSHGGRRRAGSQPVSGCSHPGSTDATKEGSASAGQSAESQRGAARDRSIFSGIHSHTLCATKRCTLNILHHRLVLKITIDWWLVCNLGNAGRRISLLKALEIWNFKHFHTHV